MIIYKATNLLNGHYYIGQTRSAINRAIEKSATSRGYKWSRDKG